MTDIVALAEKLHHKINQQKTPVDVDWVDQVRFIMEAIEDLYVISGRTFLFSEEKIRYDESGVPAEFADTLQLDERRWV